MPPVTCVLAGGSVSESGIELPGRCRQTRLDHRQIMARNSGALEEVDGFPLKRANSHLKTPVREAEVKAVCG